MGVSFEFLSSQIVLGALQALSSNSKQVCWASGTQEARHLLLFPHAST